MYTLVRNLMLSLLAALVFSTPLHAEVAQARIISVIDGDTVKVRDLGGMKYLVSLSGVDAPEIAQVKGRAAKDYLCSVICGKDVTIDSNKLNIDGHVLAVVYLDNTDVNQVMLEGGMAWQDMDDKGVLSSQHYRSYAHAESVARRQGAGLWKDNMVVAPWRFREISQAALFD